MEKKKKRIKISQIDKYTALYGKFGWYQAGTEKPKKDNTVVLIFQSDKKQIGKNYNKVKALKEYEGMKKFHPRSRLSWRSLVEHFSVLIFLLKRHFFFISFFSMLL